MAGKPLGRLPTLGAVIGTALKAVSGVSTFKKLGGGVVEEKSSHLAGSAGVRGPQRGSPAGVLISPANEPKASK